MAAEEIPSKNNSFTDSPDISDADVIEAMKEIGGYLDITPGDLKEVLGIAYRQAVKRIASSVHARDIMTISVHTVHMDTPATDVIDIMAEQKISGIPVLDSEGKVAGMISEKDFISRLGIPDRTHIMGIIAECIKGKNCLAATLLPYKAGDIMTSPVISVIEDVTLFQIMDIFNSRGINRVPVVDSAGMLKGIISRADIISAPLPGKYKTGDAADLI